jgi:hypothetical protein
MRSRPSPRGSRPGRAVRFTVPWFALTLLILLPATVWSAPDRSAGGVQVFGPTPATEARAKPPLVAPAAPVSDRDRVASPARANFHIAVASLTIPSLPTEDVDVVEVSAPAAPVPTMAVWPTEGTIYFLDESASPPTVITTVGTSSPNISGVDFVSDGTWGAFATLGYLYIFDMTLAAGPALTVPAIPLPGTPARRDIDPILIAHPASPSGVAVLYATGTEIHCRAIPTGAPLWGPAPVPLPSPVVEAVDPEINAASSLLFVPTEGFMTAIEPVSGAILSVTTLSTTLVREVDAQFVLGDGLCYLPASGALWVFDGTPPPVGTGAAVPGSPLPIASPLIEGNDMEVDPTGSFGFLPSLAFMYQVDLAAVAYAFVYPFPAFTAHQRNQDVIFTPIFVAPDKAVYSVQGTTYIYDVTPPGAFAPVAVPTFGTLVDGVDPAFSDTPPVGTIFTVSTLGFTHIVNAIAGAPLPFSPFTTPGVLRTDVDSKPGPMLANKVLQPTVGALVELSGFFPDDWVVTTAGGVWVVSLAGAFAPEFVPTPMTYRGGDAQPLTLLGPPEPAFSVDNPDQDFLTKCWEYKWAMNRWPYYWYYSQPLYYPHWIPFGVFGPPALVGYDVLNRYKVLLLDNNSVEILDERGNFIQNIPMPTPIMGGLIWDWDNKTVKLRLFNQLEAVINLGTIPTTGVAAVSIVPFGGLTRWYPVVDRMNGWEYMVYRGGRKVWVYDHFNGVFVTDVNLPSDVIRPPVFDEQRKVLCFPLANRTLAFINGFRLRLGLPNAVYYSPDFGAHIVGSPVFDLYNHHAIVKLRGGRLAVCDVDNGAIRWDSGILPYWPVGPIRIDCYNKIAKGFFRDAANYYEMHLNLYPLATGGIPVLTWLTVGSVPFGYPVFDSKDGYEFYRASFNTIAYNNLFNPILGGIVVTPAPMVGNLFVDRVNKYALVRLAGPRLFWINLFRLTQGIPGATQVINLTDALANPVNAEDDIVFDTQGHYATVHLANNQVALINMRTGSQTHVSNGLPPLQRQLYGHPFAHLANYPWFAGDVTINLSGIYTGAGPTVNVIGTTANPTEATDFVAPPPPPPPVELGIEPGNLFGMVQFEFPPGSLAPGTILQVTNSTKFNTDRMDDPTEAVAEFDGSAEVSVIADGGDMICFVAFDLAGNASPATCVAVVTGIEETEGPIAFAFDAIAATPADDLARFRFAIPERARVEIAVFDIAGRRVATVADAVMDPGRHEALWLLQGVDGSPASSGVYLVRFRSGSYESVKRVVVAR